MPSLLQIIKKNRKNKKIKKTKLQCNPQKKAVCLRVFTISPKKPNSANRRIAKTNIVHYRTKLTTKIPGEGCNIQQHSTVLIQGARVRDLIAVSYKAIRGKYDFSGVINRKTRRSLYGVKKKEN
jgi:small subunit ribosomal protein S12